MYELTDPMGGLFQPLPKLGLMRPVWSWGPKDQKVKVDCFLYQCPVSAIPEEVFSLLATWRVLRLMRLAPPVVTPLVRRSFVVFENEMRRIEGQRANPEVAAEHAAALAVGSMVKLLGVGGRRR